MFYKVEQHARIKVYSQKLSVLVEVRQGPRVPKTRWGLGRGSGGGFLQKVTPKLSLAGYGDGEGA